MNILNNLHWKNYSPRMFVSPTIDKIQNFHANQNANLNPFKYILVETIFFCNNAKWKNFASRFLANFSSTKMKFLFFSRYYEQSGITHSQRWIFTLPQLYMHRGLFEYSMRRNLSSLHLRIFSTLQNCITSASFQACPCPGHALLLPLL